LQNEKILATVMEIYDFENDGGFYYQNLKVTLTDNGKNIPLRVLVKDIRFDQLKVGEGIYLIEDVSPDGKTVYQFAGSDNNYTLIVVLILFALFALLILGWQGMKYIFPSILIFFLVFSGGFQNILTAFNVYVASFIILIIAAIAGIITHTKNIQVTFIVVTSKVMTLLIVLMLNTLLFQMTSVIDLYYNDLSILNGEVSIDDYWSVINVAVIFFNFGVSINTTLDSVANIIRHKKRKSSATLLDLIKEGITHNQLYTARAINSLFFVFLGMQLFFIVFSTSFDTSNLIEIPSVTQGLLLFINASVAALLVGPISTLVSAIFYHKELKIKTLTFSR